VALTNSELERIRFELGYPNLSTSAEPYIGITAFFSQILQPYLLSGASTTSATPVTAATTPTPQTLALVSATGIEVGNVVVVDVDARQERATVASVSGNNITLQLSLAHSGTYPVTVEGAESIIRDILNQLRRITDGMNGKAGVLTALASRAGIKRVEGEVEFFGGGNTLASQGKDPVTQLFEIREMWRDELASAVGLPRMNGNHNGGGSGIGVY
jgi:hypothetical protein